jgi:hypothetical protein
MSPASPLLTAPLWENELIILWNIAGCLKAIHGALMGDRHALRVLLIGGGQVDSYIVR